MIVLPNALPLFKKRNKKNKKKKGNEFVPSFSFVMRK